MVHLIAEVLPLIPAWLPMLLAAAAGAAWIALAICRPYTIMSRYEAGILAVGILQGAAFYFQIYGAEAGLISPTDLEHLVAASRWVFSWFYGILLITALWAWRRRWTIETDSN